MESKTFDELLDIKFKEKQKIINPWLSDSSLALLFAPRGVGKTFFSMWLAHSIACGQNLFNWQIQKRRVLYLDGEMGLYGIQKRFKAIEKSVPYSIVGGDMEIMSFAKESGVFPNISDEKIQATIWEKIQNFDVIFIDNLLTCAGRISNFDNEFRIWERLQKWLVFLREKNKAVILIHHTSKAGDQSGTIQKENIMDAVISLRKSPAAKHDGCSFEFHVTKARDFLESEAPPMVCKLHHSCDSMRWEHIERDLCYGQFIADKAGYGWSDNDLSHYLNCNRGLIKELKFKYKHLGTYDTKTDRDSEDFKSVQESSVNEKTFNTDEILF